MNTKYFNPFTFISSNYTGGMDFIALYIAGLPDPLSPTIENVVDATFEYISDQYLNDPSPIVIIDAKSFVYSTLNAYLNVNSGDYLQYNSRQMDIIYQLLEGTVKCNNIEEISQYITDIEGSIFRRGFTTEEQAPLLYATQIGKAAYTYWKNIIEIPASNWSPFISSFGGPLLSFPIWIAVSMEGSLLGQSMAIDLFKKDTYPSIEAQLSINGYRAIATLFGCLSICSAKVIFKIQPVDVDACCN